MTKKFKSIVEQMNYLHLRKCVYFTSVDRNKAYNILLDCNYYNFVSCGKVKMSLGLNEQGNHIYKKMSLKSGWISMFLIKNFFST